MNKKGVEKIQIAGVFILFLASFLGYSYFNYKQRADAVDIYEQSRQKHNLTEIFYFRHERFNVFDWVLGDKTKVNTIVVKQIKKIDNSHYWVQFSSWKDLRDLETLSNMYLTRDNEIFRISVNDVYWIPTSEDSLHVDEIDRTVFEVVDKWIKKQPVGNKIVELKTK